MPSSPKIPKETILKHALEMLIQDGYSLINIKSLAKRIGCSTQPISWHFGNMEGLRSALADYALIYANNKMTISMDSATEAFKYVGEKFVEMAVKEPNLFRFVFLNESGYYPVNKMGSLSSDSGNPELIKMISDEFQISEKDATNYLQDTIIYTHGIATLVSTGVMEMSEQEILSSINRVGDKFLLNIGVSQDQIYQHNMGE